MKANLFLNIIILIGLNSLAQVPYTSRLNPGVTIDNIVQDTVIGCTYYDLQTNGSISNRLIVNSDGTISAAWVTSPYDAIQPNPPYPNRGTGYNYWDGLTWVNPLPFCPSIRIETIRTGFTNIVVTSSGAEMSIAHSTVAGTGNYNKIVVNRRSAKGTGPWSLTSPFGSTAHDTWPKACSAGTNVYAIWQGSGAGANTTSSPPIVAGQTGPIFFTRSIDDGLNWDTQYVPHLIDSTFYRGFTGDCYSIDAKDNIVVIGFGNMFTDVGILKSLDSGLTWTKTIIFQHPIPFYAGGFTDINNDGIADTIFSNGGDVKVLIDNNGMVHAWFSELRYCGDSIPGSAVGVNIMLDSDGLEYWNENMGINNYVEIATTQDFNGNGKLDIPVDTSTICTNVLKWGKYNGGLTIMPSAGIDASGTIFLTYATINELADTTTTHQMHRHIYMMSLAPPYNVTDWTFPFDIIPPLSVGGQGELQEGAYASIARNVGNAYAYVLYQRDNYPGQSQATANSCEQYFNDGNSSDIILAKIDKINVGVSTFNNHDIFVSQNYPNPANGFTYINIGLRKTTDIHFEVYDIVGKIIYTEDQPRLATGHHTISFDTRIIKPGIYNYTVIADGLKATKRMVVEQ